ncbi:hypothetical protein QYM36_001189 [Artemia franciscana]|uniref:Uncharacterized protein n=1 Tax=Artemia franciscana TaxID=6661 RepID=A0AA88IDE9_ARTSF|nr:hypothetical protein QYM36_001189 [Artemia franciscana]
MCAAKCTWALYAVPVWIAALNKKYIVRLLRSVQRLSLILIRKSFRTAQTDGLTALEEVLPVDLRAKELTIMRYAKTGRLEYWPEASAPVIPMSSRIKSLCIDEVITVFLDVHSDDSSNLFPLDRRKLKIALYEKWHQDIENLKVRCLNRYSVAKSFRTAQTDGLTALEEVLPVDLRAKELTIMRYAKTGRLEYWPEASAPVIPMSSRIKSLCIDEVITVFLDVHSDDSSNLFPLDRHIENLKIRCLNRYSVAKSFRTAQTDGLTALEEVLPVDLRAKELTIMRYAKTGRLEYWPEASAPVIPMSSRIKSLCIDEVITVFLDVHSDDSSNLFPLDRHIENLKIRCLNRYSVAKSFRTAQTDGLTALEEVLPVDLRAKELTIMRYAKTGRLEYWPEASAPVIPMSSRIKSLCIDEL